MSNYYIKKETEQFLKWEGRILRQKDICYMGYTNSSVSFRVKGSALHIYLITGENEEVNRPGLRVYLDGRVKSQIVLEQKEGWYPVCELDPQRCHDIRIVKITEAAMSYVGLKEICVEEGELLPVESIADSRTKVEFIGDSITCGYGVHGEPESEYTIREEDGECSYAAFMAQKMNWNARWISASGYGMYVEYTGNPENNVPKLYPYVNWFVDNEEKIQAEEFQPSYIFINLGTNDSQHLGDKKIREDFLEAYERFLKQLRSYHSEAVLICILGTLCRGVFPYIEQVVEKVKKDGMEKVYAFELPYHNVKEDGMASMHPSITTHKKDAERILEFMEQECLL